MTRVSEMSFEELLEREDLLGEAPLQRVREHHRASGLSFGRVVVDLGLMEEHEKNFLMQKFLGFELIPLKDTQFDPSLLRLIPRSFADRHHVVVLGRLEDQTLLVAMEDPSDRLLIRLLEDQLGTQIRPLLARRVDLLAALRHYDDRSPAPPTATEAVAPASVTPDPERPAPRRLLRTLIMLAIFLPLPLLFCLLRYDVGGLGMTINGAMQSGTLSLFDLCVYVTLGWVLWALILYEIGGLLERVHRPQTAA